MLSLQGVGSREKPRHAPSGRTRTLANAAEHDDTSTSPPRANTVGIWSQSDKQCRHNVWWNLRAHAAHISPSLFCHRLYFTHSAARWKKTLNDVYGEQLRTMGCGMRQCARQTTRAKRQQHCKSRGEETCGAQQVYTCSQRATFVSVKPIASRMGNKKERKLARGFALAFGHSVG